MGMGGIDPPHKECLRGQVWLSIEVQSIFLKWVCYCHRFISIATAYNLLAKKYMLKMYNGEKTNSSPYSLTQNFGEEFNKCCFLILRMIMEWCRYLVYWIIIWSSSKLFLHIYLFLSFLRLGTWSVPRNGHI